MKKTMSIFLIFSLVLVTGTPALADDSDIFGKDIEPNVMLLFDTSSSMNQDIPSVAYDPSTTYPVGVTSTVVYHQRKPRDPPTVYKNSIADVPDKNARDSLSTVGYWAGKIGGSKVYLRLGNYINFWNCSTCAGLEKKLVAAKRVITNLIQNIEGVRFGVMRLRKVPYYHGEMVAPIGTDKQTMIDAVNNMVYESGTPLGEQLYDAGQYYKGKPLIDGTTWTSPIQYLCQPNFVVMFTDGAESGSKKVANEAKDRFNQDHASWLTGKQNVIVHTVAFGLAGLGQAIDNLKKTAKNGGGNYFEAENSAQLEIAFLDAVNQILAATFTFASPVIPTTSTTGSTRAYVASFQSDVARPFWRGFLKAYQRDAKGEVPVDQDDVPLASALIWEAGQLLSQKLASARTIFTSVGGAKQDFTKSNAAIAAALLNAADSAERDNIIDFVRGIDAFDEDLDADVTEERAWKLGDIFHSSPVLVSPPIAHRVDPTYDAFKQANVSRTTVLIAGANDGMLHAFRESDGEELWAFIPPDLLGSLKDLTERSAPHSFYVDSSPIAADIKIGGVWK
ncbi:MAG: PilC/PilY family type IV pilus protein, partial [Nitrospiraceae bacterium]